MAAEETVRLMKRDSRTILLSVNGDIGSPVLSQLPCQSFHGPHPGDERFATNTSSVFPMSLVDSQPMIGVCAASVITVR